MYSDTYGKQKISLKAKLKFYCQMCRKQCKDDNGFKCHINSDSHLNQMKIFNENPNVFIEQFSQEFEEAFLDLLKLKYSFTHFLLFFRYFNKQINANKVYTEMIQNQSHVHMNGTKWNTLTGFCNVKQKNSIQNNQYLAQKNKITCEFIDNEGAIIQLVDETQDVKIKKAENKKEDIIKKEEQNLQKYIQEQVKRGQQLTQNNEEEQINEEQFELKQNMPICLEIKKPKVELDNFHLNPLKKLYVGNQAIQVKTEEATQLEKLEIAFDKKKNQQNIDTLLGNIKQKQNIFDSKVEKIDYKDIPWVHPNIIVKVLDQNLKNGKFFNKKGIVREIINNFGAIIEMLTPKRERIQIDQEFLQTVIPKLNNNVMVLKPGPYRGKIGKLESIHQDNFSASIYIQDEDLLLEMPYELFSKIQD